MTRNPDSYRNRNVSRHISRLSERARRRIGQDKIKVHLRYPTYTDTDMSMESIHNRINHRDPQGHPWGTRRSRYEEWYIGDCREIV